VVHVSGLYFGISYLCSSRFGLQAVYTLCDLMFKLSNSLTLHVLVRGKKRIRFFPRPCYQSILWIKRPIICLLLCNNNSFCIYVLPFLAQSANTCFMNGATCSLIMGNVGGASLHFLPLCMPTLALRQSHVLCLQMIVRPSVASNPGLTSNQSYFFLVV